MWLVLVLAAAGAARAELTITAETLDRLPAGSTVQEGVRALSAEQGGGMLFTDGGITVPTAGNLSAESGTVELDCRLPVAWPARSSRTLFHAGGEGAEVSLMVRRGTLSAVYRPADGAAAVVADRIGRGWEAESRHEIRLSWRKEAGRTAMFLSADGELLGVAEGDPIADWPDECHVGWAPEADAWGSVLERVMLSPTAVEPAELQPGSRTVRVLADRTVGTCYDFWKYININKPHIFLEPGFTKAIHDTSPHVTGVNLVYLLGGRYEGENEWYKGRDERGRVVADFTGMIEELRAAMEAGFAVKVVLDNVPFKMSDPPTLHVYGNTAPPADEGLWHQYVRMAVQAMVDAFGEETVSGWTFRVGTEPDLRPGHWSGTREQYFAHYDHTVDAVRSVLSKAKVGPGNILNPSAAMFGLRFRSPWGLDMIEHAGEGENACTGGTGAPIDFFSCSWYASVGRPVSIFDYAIEAMRTRLDRYPQFRDAWIEIGEFAVLRDEFGRRLYAGDTTEWSASFYAALAERIYHHGVRYVYEWDHATFGVMHPKGHVIGMLKRMQGGDRLDVEVADADSAATCGALAARRDGRLFVLVYNHRPWRRPNVPEAVRLEVVDPRMAGGGAWTMSAWSVDEEKTVWAYEFEADCEAAGLEPERRVGRYEGSPLRGYGEAGEELFLANIEKYRRLSRLPQTVVEEPVTPEDGRVTLELEMPGHSVRFIELTPPQPLR